MSWRAMVWVLSGLASSMIISSQSRLLELWGLALLYHVGGDWGEEMYFSVNMRRRSQVMMGRLRRSL